MRGRRYDQDEYRIRKRQFDDQEEQDKDQWWKFNPDPRRKQQRARNGGTETEKKKDNFNAKELLDFIKPKKNKQRNDEKKDYKAGQDEPTVKDTKRQNVQCLGKLYLPKNKELKEDLDNELSQYMGGEIQEKSERGKKQRPKLIEDKESDWGIGSDKDDKETSETNKKQEKRQIDLDSSENSEKNKKEQNKDQKQEKVTVKANQTEKKEKEAPIVSIKKNQNIQVSQSQEQQSWFPVQNHQSSLNNARLGTTSYDLSSLIANEDFLEEAISSKKTAENGQLTEEQVRIKLSQLSSFKKVILSLKFEAEQNVLEFQIKQIELVVLRAVVRIPSNGKPILKKYPNIQSEILSKYVTFSQTNSKFPDIRVSLQEPKHEVEGEEQHFQQINNEIEIEFCRICCQQPIKQNQTLDKSLVVLRMVTLQCMECRSKNEITVIQSDYSAACSCKNCSAKIMGKILQVRAEEQQW